MNQPCNTSERPARILYVIDTLEVGGAERSLGELVRRVDRRRFEIHVCHVYAGDALRGAIEEAGSDVVCLEVPEKYHFVTAVRRLLRTIDRLRPDLIHTTLFRADQIGRLAGAIKRVPVVSSLVNVSYDTIRLRDNPHLTWWKLRAMQAMDMLTCRLVRRFHAVAESVKTANVAHLRIRPDRVTVVPRGRELARFANAPLANSAAWAGQADRPRVVSVGRLIDQKGHKYLIEAMPAVQAAFPSATLQIAGSGWAESSLRDLALRLGVASAVQFLGQRDDIPRLLDQADVFAFPSLYEGLPGAVLEAMLAGRPVVASDLPVAHELIDQGIHGLLVPRMDAKALAVAIVQLLGDDRLRQRIAAEARRRARERFDIENVVRQMETIWSEVSMGR